MNGIIGHRYFHIVDKKWIWFIFSGIILTICIAALLIRGLNFGIDFKGGTSIEIETTEKISTSKVRDTLGDVGQSEAVIQSAGKNRFIIRIADLSEEEETAVRKTLKEQLGAEIIGFTDVGPGWGSQVTRQALISLGIFLIVILIYISLRFEFKMAICAIIALFHDVVVTIGVYALIGREVTPATVIAVLTILGYSLYDTIVVFDRVKENADQLTRQSKKTYSMMANDSVNQTLTRSLNTSFTTLIPIASILLFGGGTLKAFAFALFVGVIAGTYSSIFIASTLLATWKESEPKYKAYRARVKRFADRDKRGKPKKKVAPVSGGIAEEPAPMPKKPRLRVIKGEREPVSAEELEAKPIVKKKPVQKPAAGVTKKGAAKQRTKGPGSGKKRRKKKNKKKR